MSGDENATELRPGAAPPPAGVKPSRSTMRSLTGPFRSAFAGLTTRGRAFLASGAAAAVCAVLLGQRDLLRVAALLAFLPLGSILTLGAARHRLSLTRTMAPARVTAGAPVRVRLELVNRARTGTRVLLTEDRVPPALGASPRFVLTGIPRGRATAVSYPLRPAARGRYPVGPATLRLADPFGMCEVTRAFSTADPLVVVPRTWPLGPVRAGGRWAGAGTGPSPSGNSVVAGEEDTAPREYRHGDDLRRVHWRATARRGELMVRQDEQPRQRRATVLLDTRRNAHRGEDTGSSFEWAVSATASIAVALVEQRYAVRLLCDGRATVWSTPGSPEAAGTFLDELASISPAGPETLTAAIGAASGPGRDGLLVAVLGEVAAADAAALAALGRRGGHGMAILLRTPRWAGLPAEQGTELDTVRERAGALLRSGGWTVTEAGPEETPVVPWNRLTGRAVPNTPASGAASPAGGVS
jgi:uncharacterized protein (DUF58 family)